MAQKKINKKMVGSLLAGSKANLYWDTEPKGFGLKFAPSGTKTYIIQYRLEGGRRSQTKRVTIGGTVRLALLKMQGRRLGNFLEALRMERTQVLIND